jgi:hypothetical protein
MSALKLWVVKQTLIIHWHVNIHDGAIDAKDLAQMVLIYVLGELLYNDLGIVSNCLSIMRRNGKTRLYASWRRT